MAVTPVHAQEGTNTIIITIVQVVFNTMDARTHACTHAHTHTLTRVHTHREQTLEISTHTHMLPVIDRQTGLCICRLSVVRKHACMYVYV